MLGLVVALGLAVALLPGLVLASAEEEGLAVNTLTGLESSTTPHTLQVLCSLPIRVVVGSSTTVQSVAT